MKKFKVFFLSSAKKDLKEARAWYKNVNKSLPSRFRMDINGVVDILQNRPTVFSCRYQDVRVAHLKFFPYGLHYLIDGQNVVVLGVFHTSIDPDKWDERRFKL